MTLTPTYTNPILILLIGLDILLGSMGFWYLNYYTFVDNSDTLATHILCYDYSSFLVQLFLFYFYFSRVNY